MHRTASSFPGVVGLFALPVALGAFLLFQVEPIAGKYILPWYGGSPGVWTACLVFFQVLLFAGYLYAHLSITYLRPVRQVLLHAALLALALIPPLLPAAAWKPAGQEQPLLRILAALAVSVGPSFFVLAATGPLLQAWFSRVTPDRSPYPLYAVSNAGSLIALLSYPFVVEPLMSLAWQAGAWRILYVCFAAPCVFCGRMAWKAAGCAPGVTAEPGPAHPLPGAACPGDARRGRLRKALWILFPACGVVLFMAMTNQLSASVASAPFVWIIPLAVYLLTFIVAFSRSGLYRRPLFAALLIPAMIGLYVAIPDTFSMQLGPAFQEGLKIRFRLPFLGRLAVFSASLFVLCMICHGELFRLKPAARGLTAYYLCVSFGGMLGGLFVGVLAPLIFSLYTELRIALPAVAALLAAAVFLDLQSRAGGRRRGPMWVLAACGFILLVAVMVLQEMSDLRNVIAIRRSFFGTLSVNDEHRRDERGNYDVRMLMHGPILHGEQIIRGSPLFQPTSYYAEPTALGMTMRDMRARPRPLRVGVAGLGAGTLAVYGRPGDVFRFYEINPMVTEMAQEYFTFMERCPASWTVVHGDARLSLERESGDPLEAPYDVLVLDAFNGDAIPVHLLTREAFELYARRLAPDGVIAVHISNRHVDLAPVLFQHVAAMKGFAALQVLNTADPSILCAPSTWMLVTRDPAFLKRIEEAVAAGKAAQGDGKAGKGRRPELVSSRGDPSVYRRLREWTDDYSNLFGVLR